jgi:SPP1 family predicted phage head-tail adaptor
MDPSKLRNRLSFQSKSSAVNSVGESTGWQTYYTAWGSVNILRAQMMYSTGDFISKATYDVRIRWTASQTFNVGDRIVREDGTIFQIDSVMDGPGGYHFEIQMLCHVLDQTES